MKRGDYVQIMFQKTGQPLLLDERNRKDIFFITNEPDETRTFFDPIYTNVIVGSSFAGAVMTTRLAPAVK